MTPRFAFSSLAVCFMSMAMSLTPQIAEARGHGGFHGGGFHGGGFRGGFYGGGFGRGFYGGGFGRGFYGGGVYANRGFYGGYRGFYPRYYGGFSPRYYGSYFMSPGYYGGGYSGYGYRYGGYAPAYGGCTCANYSVNNGGYLTTSLGGSPSGSAINPVPPVNAATSNSLFAYHLKNNPYNKPQVSTATIVRNGIATPADSLPYAKYMPVNLSQRTTVPPPPTPML